MTAQIKDFDPSAPRDYERGCPVCGRTDVVAEKTYKGEPLIWGHTCYPPFAGDE
jgi:hypothetical protein